MQEMRRYDRVKMDRLIVVQLSSGEFVRARLVDLSVGGLGVLYPSPAELGSVLGLHFQLPDEKDQPASIQCKGIVRHFHMRETAFLSGFEFTQISDDYRKLIAQFINRKRATMQMHMVIS